MRIVSLVPSWTEWLCDLGQPPIGVTKFCVHPEGMMQRSERIGGTKQIDVERINALKPDLVLSSKEENVKAQVEALSAPVLVTDVCTVFQAWETMRKIAEAVDRVDAGNHWIHRIQAAWGEPRECKIQASYVIWKAPWMVAGAGTYIHDVLRWWGVQNAHANRTRYPEVEAHELSQNVLLSSEPYPFRKDHRNEPDLVGRKVTLINGEAFSWYGSRMWHALQDLKGLAGCLGVEVADSN